MINYDVKDLLHEIHDKLDRLIENQGEDRLLLGKLSAEMTYMKWAFGMLSAVVGGVILKILGVVGG